jgi:hypothetical protein
MFLVGKLVRAVVFRASEGVPTGNLTTVTVLEQMTVNSRIADRFANDRSRRLLVQIDFASWEGACSR